MAESADHLVCHTKHKAEIELEARLLQKDDALFDSDSNDDLVLCMYLLWQLRS